MTARTVPGSFPVRTSAGARHVDSLEVRRLYTVTPVPRPTPLALTGDGGADAFYLRLVAAGTLGVWVNAAQPGQGTPTRTVPLSQVTAVAASGTGADAALTLDLSGGLAFPGGVTWDGGAAAGPLVVVGASGTVTFGGNTVTAGGTTATYGDAGGVVVDAGANPTAFAVTDTPAVPIRLDGYAADTLAVTGGQPTLDAASTAGPTLTVNDGSGLTIAAAGGRSVGAVSLAGLTVGAGASAAVTADAVHAGSVLSVGSLSVANTGGLNLNGADLIVHNGNAQRVAGWVRAGRGSDGTIGIGSPVVDGDGSGTKALAPALNVATAATATAPAVPLARSFDGQLAVATDVIVADTVAGDLTLDGVVDGADYTRLDVGAAAGLTGWANGDVNLDGVVDGSDYTLVDNGYDRYAYSSSSSWSVSNGTGLGADPWSPADIPGLVAWYKASPATVATDATGAVTRWSDLSGHGNDLVPVAGAARPVLSPDGTAVQFPYYVGTGTGPMLATTGPVAITPGDVSLFAAVKQEDVGNDYRTPTGVAAVVSQGVALGYASQSGRWQFGDGAGYTQAVPAASGTQRVVVGLTSGGTGVGVTTYQNGVADAVPSAAMSRTPVRAPLTVGSPTDYPNASETEVCLYDRPLTAGEAAALNSYLASADGVPTSPTLDAVVDGDSMSFDLNLPGSPVNTWVDQTPALATAAVHNYARGGRQLAQIDPSTGQSEVSTEQNSFAGFEPGLTNLYVVFAGSNDVYNGGRSAADTFASLLALCDGAKAYGAAHGIDVRTLVVTGPRRGLASGKTGYDGVLNQYDQLIRADRSGAFDGVADIAALPQLQNPNDTAYFAADSIHPNAAGEAVIANAVNATIAAVFRGA